MRRRRPERRLIVTTPLPAAWQAGCVRRHLPPGDGSHHLPITIWYPTHAGESRLRIGIFDLSVALDAPPAVGRFPLIAISHGSGGSDVNHHDWAEALARAGFVVVAAKHVGDSHDFQSGLGSREQLLERPRQLRQAIRAAKADPVVGPQIADGPVGLLGFSAGGYTCLITMGARPAFSRWADHCRTNPQAETVCPVGRAPTLPVVSAEDWEGVVEPLAGAAVLLAPFAMVFDQVGLADVRAPVRLYRAEDESITLNHANADILAEYLPQVPETVTVPGDHYVFIAPIEDGLADKYPLYYRDGPEVDRRRIHRQLAGEIVDFFQRKLHADSSSPAPR